MSENPRADRKLQFVYPCLLITSKNGNAASKMKNTPPCITDRGSWGSSIKLKQNNVDNIEKTLR